MTRVLVTGAAGFIGSHVCDRLLSEGHPTLGLDDLSAGREANLTEAGRSAAFSFERFDVRSPDLTRLMGSFRPEVVCHLAAQSSVAASAADPVADAAVNVVGSVNVLRAAVSSGVRKVVYAASGGTMYGDPSTLPVREEARVGARPPSPYGISKRVVEDYLWFEREAAGLDFTVLALANVYGPRQDPRGEAGVVSIFAGRMLEGAECTIFGDGEQTRDFVHVADVSIAFARALEAGPAAVLNVSSGVETSVNEIFERLAGIVGYERVPVHAPPRPGEIHRIALDPGEAERSLGRWPRTALGAGLEETVRWIRRSAGPG